MNEELPTKEDWDKALGKLGPEDPTTFQYKITPKAFEKLKAIMTKGRKKIKD